MILPERAWGVSLTAILRFVSVCFHVFLMGLAINGFTARRGTPQIERAVSVGWDREGAAKYLDERMELWFTTAKKLRTGQSETACVSCHTTIPYVLARPALRRAMHVSSATPLERRLVEETTRRVESYDSHQPLYDFNESKKTESRGTEAVLNALILVSADAALSRREPSAPTQQALDRMWKTQRPDGAWDWLDFGLEPFESVDGAYYGATLAALTIGIAPGYSNSNAAEPRAGIEKMRGYLKEKYASQSLFNRVWLLLAATRLNDLLTKAQRESLIAEIQSRQRDDGGWALDSLGAWRWSKTAEPFKSPGTLDASLLAKSDGFATGLIIYTLRQSGLQASRPPVSKGLQWLRANQSKVEVSQQAWPVWRAHSLNYDRERGGEKGEPWRRMFMSDSATAFAAMALVASD
jgi:squalene-hopene/tetraprenyl-beta-curcumene cyclase